MRAPAIAFLSGATTTRTVARYRTVAASAAEVPPADRTTRMSTRRTRARRRPASSRPSSIRPPTLTTVALPFRHSSAPGASSSALASDGGRTTATPTATSAPTPATTATVRRCRPANTTVIAPVAATADPAGPTSGSGRLAPHRATHAIHARSAREGRWSMAAAVPPSRPAGRPAARPHTINGPAAGTARRLAGIDANGMPPKTGMSTGATPAWAETVTASGAGTPRASRPGPTRAMPAQAPVERRNPTDPTSNGSISTRAVTAKANIRMGEARRPVDDANIAIPAIATARSTDGSHRVSTPNTVRTSIPATTRRRRPRRRSRGAAMTITKATF